MASDQKMRKAVDYTPGMLLHDNLSKLRRITETSEASKDLIPIINPLETYTKNIFEGQVMGCVFTETSYALSAVSTMMDIY